MKTKTTKTPRATTPATTTTATRTVRSIASPLIAAALLSTLAACGGSDGQTAGHDHSAATVEAGPHSASNGSITLADGWVKTGKKDGMTAVFGTLRNDTDDDITVTGAKSDAAGSVQLHETVNDSSGSSKMREKKGGFTVSAHGRSALKPGGDHIMLMKLTDDIKPGEQLKITLVTTAGEKKVGVTAKDYTGAKEEYDMDSDHGTHTGK